MQSLTWEQTETALQELDAEICRLQEIDVKHPGLVDARKRAIALHEARIALNQKLWKKK